MGRKVRKHRLFIILDIFDQSQRLLKVELTELIVSLLSLVAAAGPTRTAVEPAAVYELCPSTDFGTSGERPPASQSAMMLLKL